VQRRFITEVEVAEITGRAVATLRNDRYYRRGLPFFKFGRSVRYSEEEVLAFMEACKVKTTGDY